MEVSKLVEELQIFLAGELPEAESDPDYDASICSISIPRLRTGPFTENAEQTRLSNARRQMGLAGCSYLNGVQIQGIEFRLRSRCHSASYTGGDDPPILEIAMQYSATDQVRIRDGIAKDIARVVGLIEAAGGDGYEVDWFVGSDADFFDCDHDSDDAIWFRRY
jgi:hypothetical protein